ncbi:hypothetical protein ABZ721_40310 [Streptomyces sp. NPDC006733]|uniref:hypothetical protein n=1 Tax=Streptomyces sp. NPDC006733 TaxID=3155460 RepID=UPI0033F435C8
MDYLPVTLHDPMRMTVTVVSERGEMTVVRAEVGRVLLPGVASMAIHAVVVSANFEGQEVVLRVELGSGDLIEACIELPTCVTAPAA